MNKKIYISVLLSLLIVIAIIVSCNKTSNRSASQPTTTPATPIDPTDANALQKALVIPGATFMHGNFPVQTSGVQTPVLSDYQQTVSISPGNQLLIPCSFTSGTGYLNCYVHITGATNGYYQITGLKPTALRITSGSGIDSGSLLIPITLPSNLGYGNFCVDYIIEDDHRIFSNSLNSCVTVVPPLSCSNAGAQGSDGLTFTQVQMNGGTEGTVVIDYDTYTVPDRIDVYQGTTWMTGTGSNPNSLVPPQCNCNNLLPGFVGQASQLTFNYDSTKGKNITVVVSGCLGGGTAWTWSMTCP